MVSLNFDDFSLRRELNRSFYTPVKHSPPSDATECYKMLTWVFVCTKDGGGGERGVSAQGSNLFPVIFHFWLKVNPFVYHFSKRVPSYSSCLLPSCFSWYKGRCRERVAEKMLISSPRVFIDDGKRVTLHFTFWNTSRLLQLHEFRFSRAGEYLLVLITCSCLLRECLTRKSTASGKSWKIRIHRAIKIPHNKFLN